MKYTYSSQKLDAFGSEMYGVHIGEIREVSTVSPYDVFEIVRNDVRFTKFRIVYLSRLA
eukprot:UN18699